eukprot:394439_1
MVGIFQHHFDIVKDEKDLRLDPLSQLLSHGYSEKYARPALSQCNNDVTEALTLLMNIQKRVNLEFQFEGVDTSKSIIPSVNRSENNADNVPHIVSTSDGKIMLFILFEVPVKMYYLKIYAAENADPNDVSAPRLISVYHVDDTNCNNIDCNNIKSIKSLKTIQCSINELNKGQRISLNGNFKQIIIFIESNQNNTKYTYFNGIHINWNIIPESENDYHQISNDDTDINIREQLMQLETHIDPINSAHLCDSNINRTDTHCQIENCNSVHRLSTLLQKYHFYNRIKTCDEITTQNMLGNNTYLDTICENFGFDANTIKKVYAFITQEEYETDSFKLDMYIENGNIARNICTEDNHTAPNLFGTARDIQNYETVSLLNDFNHLLTIHSSDFEDIYNILIKQSHHMKVCDISKCSIRQRNYRNRTMYTKNEELLNNLYFNDGESGINVIKLQLMDRIHCYYFHTFDIGYKLPRKQINRIMSICSETKQNDDIDSSILDAYATEIHKLIGNNNIDSDFKQVNDKFILNDNVYVNAELYQYGFRYFYWDFYKNNRHLHDSAHPMFGVMMITDPPANVASRIPKANRWGTLGHFYISLKFSNLKQELTQNPIFHVSITQFLHLVQKAEQHIKTDMARELTSVRKARSKCYGIQFGSPLKIDHLVAMMAHCNHTVLQFKFGETFRLKNKDETDSELKERHRNFYWLGRLLRECTECYGMKKGPNKMYHGVNKYFMYPSIFATIKCPLSTTLDYSVAVNFSTNSGMIWELFVHTVAIAENFDNNDQRKLCFDCRWLSDYVNEQEVFFIGGLPTFTFTSILEATTGTNYCNYLEALYLITDCMANDDYPLFWGNKKSETIQQIAARLLMHELYRYYPNNKNAHEFKSCPDYFKDVLHHTCLSMTKIFFTEDFFPSHRYKMHEYLFEYSGGWVNIDMVTTLFPNIWFIYYYGGTKPLSFFTQPLIYHSILNFIRKNKCTKKRLYCIEVCINSKYVKDIGQHIMQYKRCFKSRGWKIYLDADYIFNIGKDPLNMQISLVFTCLEVINM